MGLAARQDGFTGRLPKVAQQASSRQKQAAIQSEFADGPIYTRDPIRAAELAKRDATSKMNY